jgi:hypothetical protein
MSTGIAVGIFILFVLAGTWWFLYWIDRQQKRERSGHR